MAMLTLVLSLAAALPTHADVAFNEANFPDANFRSWLSSHFAEAVADGVWTDAELATVTEISCPNSNVESMVGIEHFSNLQKLTYSGSKMTQLDLSKNHNLAEVVAESSQLRALNVVNTALTKLYVTFNRLASLNCEGLNDLNNVSIGYPSQNVALDKVYKMDYNGKTYYFVWLEEEHKNLDQSLAEQMKAYEGEMGEDYVHFDPERANWNHNCEVFEGTPVTGKLSEGLDANAFPGKVLLLNPETKSFTYSYDATPDRPRRKISMPVTVTWENAVYTTAIGGIPFDEEHFPDANFRANLARNLVAETADNWLTPEELTGEHAKDLILNFAEYKDMESMEGIQYFTELEDVNFIGTKVKSVDFSQNTKLKSVSGWFSGLMSLDLSNNTALTSAELDPQHVYNWPVNKITVNGKDYYYIGLAKFAAQVKAYEGEMRETYVPFNMNRVTWGANCELFDEEVPSEGGVLSEGLSAETFNHIPVLLIDPEKTSFTYYYDVNNQVESDGKMEVIVKWVLEDTPLEGIPFDEEHFPDANFRANLARNMMAETADLWLTPEELTGEHAKDLILNFVEYKDMESMEGIQYFTALEYVNFIGTKVKSVDFSQNTKLKSVSGWFSGLMSLDLSNNTALTSAELDPQHVYNWPVNKITVNGKDYYYIGLAKFAAQVKAYEGEMRETYVPFNMNRVTWGANCELFDEEVPSEGGVLSEGLSAETFNHIPVLLIDPEKTSFTYYYDVNNQVESDGKMEVIVKWVLEDTPLEGIPFDEEHFPDANFRANLARNMMAETADLWLTPEELTGEHAKDLILNFAEYKEMESMEGIQYFTALESVNFIGTRVKSVDFSQNTKLKSVSGWYSGLMSLDLSNNTALTSADIDPQRVSGLPVNKITVNGKDYYYITIPNFRAFVNDYEGEMRETYVPFSLNRITWGDNCERFNGTPVAGGLSEGLSANTFNGPVLLINPEKKSFTYYYDLHNDAVSGGQMEVIVKWVLSDPLDGIPFDEEHFPDANFRRALASEFPDETADLFWTYAELATVSQIDCMGKSIVSMKGIEYFTELVLLRCYNNALGQDDQPLDLSSNVALQNLVGWNNYDLKQIILPETESLTSIHVSDCALTSLDVTKNPNLESLKCTNNELTWLDLTQNTKLRTLLCRNNQLTSLDLSQNTELMSYQGGGQTLNKDLFGSCNGWKGKNYYFYTLENGEPKGDGFLSLQEAIRLVEGETTTSFVPFSLDRVTWVSGCEVIQNSGSDAHKAPRGAIFEGDALECYPILYLTDTADEREGTFKYDYDVNSPNNLSAMDVTVTYDKPITTAIDTVTADANVVSVRYINVSGVSSNEPWDGVNIVVTTKADGTQSVTKVLR